MKTAMLVVVMLPLIVPIWKKEPFDSKNLAVPELPTFMDESMIREQFGYYKKVKDPRIRTEIALVLAQANNAFAVKTLEEMLRIEKNPLVIIDILNSLYEYRGKVKIANTGRMKKYQTNSEPMIRALSTALCMRKNLNAEEALKSLEKEKSDYIINFLTDEIDRNSKHLNPSVASLKKLAGSDYLLKKTRALYLLSIFEKTPDNSDLLKKAVKSEEPLVRLALAMGLAGRKNGGDKLMTTLSGDPINAIRSVVAGSEPDPVREALFLKLAGDKDWEIRRLSCLSLGSYKDAKAVNRLIKSCEDPVWVVRTAAEDSLIKIHPGEGARKQLRVLLHNKVAQNSAIRVLGKIDDQKAKEAIHKILDKTKSDETIKRAIYSLGDLDYKKSWQSVCSQADNKDKEVRKAIVYALERFNVPDSFGALKKLTYDKVLEVSFNAVKAVGELANPYFNDRLHEIICNVRPDSRSEMRSAASWALARVNKPTPRIIAQLKKLCLKKVLKIEGISMYDSDFSRMASCMALIEYAKKDSNYNKDAESIAKRLKEPPMMDPEFNNPTLRAYAKEAYLYLNGKKAKQTVLGSIKPELTIKKRVSKKESYRPAGMQVIPK